VEANVGQTNPQITFSPREPRPGAAVEFTAVDFISTTLIRWDFGDGSPPVQGGKEISHTYQSTGTFAVAASDSSA